MKSLAREINEQDLKREPYLDNYDPDKNYNQVLFNPDKPVLQTELNSMQSMQRNALKDTSEAIFEDGDIQDGMAFHLDKNDDEETGRLTIENGKVYLNGMVRTFNEQSIDIPLTGDAYVGIRLKKEVYTYEDDEDLLDQTSGVSSSFSDAADRRKETVLLTVNTKDTGARIYHFQDGELYINPDKPETTHLTKVLAERTFDESGSYRVEGFDMYKGKETDDPDNSVQLVIDPGKAYILGYQVDKPSTTRLKIPKAKDTRTINSEGYYYDNEERKFSLGNGAVKSIDRVTAQVEVRQESVSRGVTGAGVDYLNNTSVTRVLRVWTDDQEYRQGQDFQLTGGQGISWAPSGLEPSSGSTYYVQYVYNKAMEENTDYQIDVQGEGDYRVWWIDFSKMSGDKPVNESLVNVDYTFYLARQDLIVLDHNGNFTVHEGEPDLLRLVNAPNRVDPYTLRMGTVTMYPNSSTIDARLWAITRLTMDQLQKISRRLDNVEYNQAVNALDDEAMESENPIYLRGVFSEGFISLEKTDTTNEENTASFDFDTASVTLPYKEINKHIPRIIEGSSEAHVWGRLVTAPFDEEVALEQPYATEPKNVNPYNVFNKQGVLTLDPSEDNWIEEDRVTVTDQETSTMRVKRWWRHQGADWTEDEINSVSNIRLDEGQAWGNQDRSGKEAYRYDTKYGRTGTTIESGGQRTKESMIEFMRKIDLTATVDNLSPNANNLVVYFDGVQVPVTPASGYRKGSQKGTGMANADGTFKGTFTIPDGIRCGTREVTVRNDNNLAAAPFTAQGTHKRVEDVIIRTRVTVNLYDPLAQSFNFRTNKVISSLDVYFASKDEKNNVICQIRGVTDGGQPNKTIYAERVMKPQDIKVSDDASVPTNITFDDPVMIEGGKEYAMVFVTDSSQYTMWIGTMGQNEIDNPSSIVTQNPYPEGVLYSSSNASAWTIHPDSDMKFTIYTANFNEKAVMEFDTMTDVRTDRILLMSSYLTPANTGCFWDMKLVLDSEPENVTVDDKDWMPITNYVDIDVEEIAREVKLRSTFKSNIYISPMLSLSDIMFVGFLTELKGDWLSRTIDQTEAPFNTIWVSYEAFTPNGSTVTPQYSLDEGETWNDFSNSATVTKANNEFKRYVLEETVGEGIETYDTIKYRLNLESKNSFTRPRARRFLSRTTDK